MGSVERLMPPQPPIDLRVSHGHCSGHMKYDAIVEASVAVLAARGLVGWTIDEVALRAGCAKGLVIYHHQSKAKLLALSAQAISADLDQARLTGLQQADPLEGLWLAVLGGVASGRFGARTALQASGVPTGRLGPAEEPIRRAAAKALEVPIDVLASETALRALLDGLSLQLLDGVGEPEVKASYDQLWLSMITG